VYEVACLFFFIPHFTHLAPTTVPFLLSLNTSDRRNTDNNPLRSIKQKVYTSPHSIVVTERHKKPPLFSHRWHPLFFFPKLDPVNKPTRNPPHSSPPPGHGLTRIRLQLPLPMRPGLARKAPSFFFPFSVGNDLFSFFLPTSC